MSEPEANVPEPNRGLENSQEQPRVEGVRGLFLQAGEWLQRPASKHMGLITTVVVLVIIYLLVLLG